MSYVAPRLISNFIAPTAPTISDAIGPAASQWVAAHSTMGASKRPRAAMALAALAGLAVGGVGTFFVARRGTAGSTESPPSTNEASAAQLGAPADGGMDAVVVATSMMPDAPSPLMDATPAPPPSPPIDAPPAPPPPLDAGARDVAPPDAGKEPPRRPERPTRPTSVPATPGTLRVEVEPWAQVSISGQKETFTTPVTVRLQPGHYRVVLKKGEKKEAIDVTITANQTSRIDRTW